MYLYCPFSFKILTLPVSYRYRGNYILTVGIKFACCYGNGSLPVECSPAILLFIFPFSVFIAADCYADDGYSEERARKHRGVLICQYAADNHKSLYSHISTSDWKINV